MYNIVLLNTADKSFTKSFQEYSAARTFFFKCTHSKRVRVVSCNFNPYR